MKKNAVHKSNSHPEKINDSPNRIMVTAAIIGFLRCAWAPVTTRFSGGSHGARVPLPLIINNLLVDMKNPNPIITNNIPIINLKADKSESKVTSCRLKFIIITKGTIIVTMNGKISEIRTLKINFIDEYYMLFVSYKTYKVNKDLGAI